MRRTRRAAVSLAAAVAMVQLMDVAVSPAQGANRSWLTPTDGIFTDDSRWSGGSAPGPTDTAIFNLGQETPYIVQFFSSVANDRLLVDNDYVELTLAPTVPPTPTIYTLTSTTAPSVVVGRSTGDIGDLIVRGLVINAVDGAIAQTGGSTGTLTLEETGTAIAFSGVLQVGLAGDGVLLMNSGAVLAAQTLELGAASSGTALARIAGTDTQLSAPGELTVGVAGRATLEVEAGALLTSGAATIGRSGASVGSVDVSGEQSAWDLGTATLVIARDGQGSLNIGASALVSCGQARIATSDGSVGLASVNGGTWNVDGLLHVGAVGSGIMEITGGGQVISGQGVVGGVVVLPKAGVTDAKSSGAVIIRGANAAWDVANVVTVGTSSFGSIAISEGGRLTAQGALLGDGTEGSALVTVTGPESTLSIAEALLVGGGGTSSGQLRAEAGGTVITGTATIGATGDAVGEVTVTDTGSTWTNSGLLRLGTNGNAQGLLYVEAGGLVTSDSASLGGIGAKAGGYGAVFVKGAESQFDLAGTLSIGLGGSGDLEISAGGSVLADKVLLGEASSLATGMVTVKDAGSTLVALTTLTVGESGLGLLDIQAGGVVDSEGSTLGGKADAIGSATVHGAGATWSNTGDVTVGHQGVGQIEISAGGAVTGSNAFLGHSSGSSGTISVAGTDSSLGVAESLYIGGDASGAQGSGSALVEQGGAIGAGTSITIWTTGTLTIKNGSVVSPEVNLAGGKLEGFGTLSSPLINKSGEVEVLTGQVLALAGPLSSTFGAALAKTGPGTLQINGDQSHAEGSEIQVVGGVLEMNTSAGSAAARHLSIDVAAGAQVKFNASQHLASLKLTGARASVGAEGTRFIDTAGLELDTLSYLDLADNDLIVRASLDTRDAVLSSVAGLIKSARNTSPNRWQGTGITSSVAATEPLTGLGVILNDRGNGTPVLTTFDGQAVDTNSILVKYTYNGDVDFSGKVDAADYFLVDSGFLAQSTGWRNGDLDFSGKVDAADYFLIDSAFLGQSAVLAGAAGAVAVPEPSTLAGAMVALLLTRRRTRR